MLSLAKNYCLLMRQRCVYIEIARLIKLKLMLFYHYLLAIHDIHAFL